MAQVAIPFVFTDRTRCTPIVLNAFKYCLLCTCGVVRLAAGRGVCVCVMSKVDVCPSACSVCSFISSCFTSRSLLNCSTTFFWGRKREQAPVHFFVCSVTRTCNEVSLTHTLSFCLLLIREFVMLDFGPFELTASGNMESLQLNITLSLSRSLSGRRPTVFCLHKHPKNVLGNWIMA